MQEFSDSVKTADGEASLEALSITIFDAAKIGDFDAVKKTHVPQFLPQHDIKKTYLIPPHSAPSFCSPPLSPELVGAILKSGSTLLFSGFFLLFCFFGLPFYWH
jgi:hypothetical protein